MPLLRIGQLARQSGFTTKTLRYYEEIGLLAPAGRRENGYRAYTDEAISRLRFVRRAKDLGLPLDDIRTILEISGEGRAPCEHVLVVVEREVSQIETQMRRLRQMRGDLLALKSRMSEAIASGTAIAGECPCFRDDIEQD